MYCFGHLEFKTKAKIRTYIKSILNRPLTQTLSEEEESFLLDLFKCHPRFGEKTNGQDVKIIRCKNEYGLGNMFKLLQLRNLVTVDISYEKCLRIINPVETLSRIFRKSIKDQINEFRVKTDQKKCQKCKEEKISLEVDHDSEQLPFRQIIKDFIEKEGIKIQDIKTKEALKGIGRELVDKDLEKRFQEYHLQHAKLRMLCKPCNCSAKRKYVDERNQKNNKKRQI